MNEPAKRIVLTGFMGAGKTTVGTALARRLDCRMIDLDSLIETREGRSVRSIIDKDGEARFREIETRAVIDALQDKDVLVIALGGGTWALERNRNLIAEDNCLTIWLDAPFELCWQRIENECDLRPLAGDKEKTQERYDQRQGTYAHDTVRVEVASKDGIEDLLARILDSLPTQ